MGCEDPSVLGLWVISPLTLRHFCDFAFLGKAGHLDTAWGVLVACKTAGCRHCKPRCRW